MSRRDVVRAWWSDLSDGYRTGCGRGQGHISNKLRVARSDAAMYMSSKTMSREVQYLAQSNVRALVWTQAHIWPGDTGRQGSEYGRGIGNGVGLRRFSTRTGALESGKRVSGNAKVEVKAEGHRSPPPPQPSKSRARHPASKNPTSTIPVPPRSPPPTTSPPLQPRSSPLHQANPPHFLPKHPSSSISTPPQHQDPSQPPPPPPPQPSDKSSDPGKSKLRAALLAILVAATTVTATIYGAGLRGWVQRRRKEMKMKKKEDKGSQCLQSEEQRAVLDAGLHGSGSESQSGSQREQGHAVTAVQRRDGDGLEMSVEKREQRQQRQREQRQEQEEAIDTLLTRRARLESARKILEEKLERVEGRIRDAANTRTTTGSTTSAALTPDHRYGS